MKANRKFNKQAKSAPESSTIIYTNNFDGSFNFIDEANGMEGEIDEKFVLAHMNKSEPFILSDGSTLELIRYDKGEVIVNPITKMKMFCPPDAVTLFEFITGNIIGNQRLNYIMNSQIDLAIEYFKSNFPLEFAVIFDKIIITEQPYTFNTIPIPPHVKINTL